MLAAFSYIFGASAPPRSAALTVSSALIRSMSRWMRLRTLHCSALVRALSSLQYLSMKVGTSAFMSSKQAGRVGSIDEPMTLRASR